MKKINNNSLGMSVGGRGFYIGLWLVGVVLALMGMAHGAKIVAWGSNLDPWFGNYAGQATPPQGDDYIAISAGAAHGIALRSNGSIVCWGSNFDQYGNYSGQAIPPAGNDFIAISAGSEHGLALKSDGSIVGWGSNLAGQATPPEGNDFVAIAACDFHSLALKADGSIVGWGRTTTPPAGKGFVAIAGGNNYSLAIRANGSIMGWDSNESVPIGSDFVAIDAGTFHNIALRADGSIIGWGWNENGQATAPTGNTFVAVAAAYAHSLALQVDGTIVGWGLNDFGQATPPEGNDFIAISACSNLSLALQKVEPIPCYNPLASDLNQDCSVNLLDLAILSEEWMKTEPAMLIARFKLNSNPSWLTQGQWEYGVPTGNGGTNGGNPDPTSGYTGTNVYGVNLSGDYTLVTGSAYALATGPISCVDFPGVTLKFARWLNTDAPEYVLCKVEASNDNTTWETIWSNPTAIEDNAWNLVEYDISNVAGSQPSVFIRWTYQVLSSRALPYSGWNIDDVEILGHRTP